MHGYLESARREFRRLKSLAEDALAQVGDDALFRTLGAESNSLAVVMQHLGGNLRSRWSDALTSDGEKPWRDRDREFEEPAAHDAVALRAQWEAGWGAVLGALEGLGDGDLERTLTIRGEPHTLFEATQRSLLHTAYHVGQMVLLARHEAGAGWRSLSIPRRGSQGFNRAPKPYLGGA